MIWIYCLIGLVGLGGAGADYTKYEEFVTQQSKNATFVRMFEKHLSQFQDQDKNLRSTETFPCKMFLQPQTKTTSVHKLRPMDVSVVGALGDSITAGTGITARTVIGLLQQDRGLSWSVGGDKSINEEETIPNFLKVYNQNIKGYSTGSGPVWWEPSSQLNVADPGDKSEDMPGQAKTIVNRMKANKNINFDEDWKVITLFVGGNDLCDYCGSEKEKYKAENYVANIQEALDYLHANVPRAFVNVVEILDIFIVKDLNENLVCDTLHLFLCECAAFPANSEAEAELRAETERYRTLLNDMVLTGRYDTRDDFTVVVQPFFSETHPPIKEGTNNDPDLSYFAPDCFHLSLKGHRAAADALWNNMIEPVGKKRTKWSPGEKVECPSAEAPYFYTYKNSDSTNSLGDTLGQFSSRDDNSDTESDSSKSNQSGFGTMPTIATVAGVLIVAFVSVMVVVAWRKRHSNKEEREILLRPGDTHYYAPI